MQLEQVKEHFKDAKEVRCLDGEGKLFEIDLSTITDSKITNHITCDNVGKNTLYVALYNGYTNKLAEIITYKDKDMKITEQQIKELDNGSTTVRQLFPQVFKTELEEGVWYVNKYDSGLLVLKNSKYNNFGFFEKKFNNSLKCSNQNVWTKANLEEVKARMTEELVRLGFVKGCSFTSPSGLNTRKNVSGFLDFEYFDKDSGWIIYINGLAVFHNGKFATLIQEPTQKEILQAKIKEIQEEIDKL